MIGYSNNKRLKEEFKELVRTVKFFKRKDDGKSFTNKEIAEVMEYELPYFNSLVGNNGKVLEVHIKKIKELFKDVLENKEIKTENINYALVYKKLAEGKELSIKKLENVLGLSNGTISKAIERNSRLKPERIDRILKIFPDINKNWLLSGEGEMYASSDQEGLNNESVKLSNKDLKDELIATQRKLIEALEREIDLLRNTNIKKEGEENKY